MAKVHTKLINWDNGWMNGVVPAMERRVVDEEILLTAFIFVPILNGGHSQRQHVPTLPQR